jgi:peroxiredoxin
MSMSSRFIAWAFALTIAALPAAGAATPAAGTRAPNFAAIDASGKPVQLSDYQGRFVVLEWTNPDCPFVRAHYGSGAMQRLQKEAGTKGVVWLSVNSTSKSHPEYKTGPEMGRWMKDKDATPAAILIDGTSEVARAYFAKTTPHMFVIDPAGAIIYAGAIDDTRSAREADRATAKNYVRAALDQALAGRPVAVATTAPYGCAVKY